MRQKTLLIDQDAHPHLDQVRRKRYINIPLIPSTYKLAAASVNIHLALVVEIGQHP